MKFPQKSLPEVQVCRLQSLNSQFRSSHLHRYADVSITSDRVVSAGFVRTAKRFVRRGFRRNLLQGSDRALPELQFPGQGWSWFGHQKTELRDHCRQGLPAGWLPLPAARPRLMLWLGLLAACACVGYSVTHLEVHTSRSQLTDREARFSRSWQQYSDTFGSAADLMVVVQSPAPNVRLIRSVIDELGEKLKREPEHFENVLSRVDLTAMRARHSSF